MDPIKYYDGERPKNPLHTRKLENLKARKLKSVLYYAFRVPLKIRIQIAKLKFIIFLQCRNIKFYIHSIN